jgi:hypothetical protein
MQHNTKMLLDPQGYLSFFCWHFIICSLQSAMAPAALNVNGRLKTLSLLLLLCFALC